MVGLAGRKASNKAFQTDRSHRFNALVDGPDLSMELNSNICYLSTRRGRGMPGSPLGDTAAGAPVGAPPDQPLRRGVRALLEVEIVEAFAEECQVAIKVGNSLAVCWASRAKIHKIIGFNPVLGGQENLILPAAAVRECMA
jgi:hypothetical protein